VISAHNPREYKPAPRSLISASFPKIEYFTTTDTIDKRIKPTSLSSLLQFQIENIENIIEYKNKTQIGGLSSKELVPPEFIVMTFLLKEILFRKLHQHWRKVNSGFSTKLKTRCLAFEFALNSRLVYLFAIIDFL